MYLGQSNNMDLLLPKQQHNIFLIILKENAGQNITYRTEVIFKDEHVIKAIIGFLSPRSFSLGHCDKIIMIPHLYLQFSASKVANLFIYYVATQNELIQCDC